MLLVHGLYISPGHNYFGRKDEKPGNHQLIEVEEIECVAGRGIRGDRFLDFKKDYKGQITFFSLEVFEQLQRELGLPQASPTGTRRNVLVSGKDLNELIGVEFQIQGIRFVGTQECSPCSWMNYALGPGADEWLRGRGGLRARILTDGILRRDTSATKA